MRALTAEEYRMLAGDDRCDERHCAGAGDFYTYDQARRVVEGGLIALEPCPHNGALAHGRLTALGRTAVLCYEALHLRLTA